MGNRSVRWALLAVLLVVGFVALRPAIEYRLYSATTPRPVEARGTLADYERSTIDIFERVSPSVVQVVGRAGGNELSVWVERRGGWRPERHRLRLGPGRRYRHQRPRRRGHH